MKKTDQMSTPIQPESLSSVQMLNRSVRESIESGEGIIYIGLIMTSSGIVLLLITLLSSGSIVALVIALYGTLVIWKGLRRKGPIMLLPNSWQRHLIHTSLLEALDNNSFSKVLKPIISSKLGINSRNFTVFFHALPQSVQNQLIQHGLIHALPIFIQNFLLPSKINTVYDLNFNPNFENDRFSEENDQEFIWTPRPPTFRLHGTEQNRIDRDFRRETDETDIAENFTDTLTPNSLEPNEIEYQHEPNIETENINNNNDTIEEVIYGMFKNKTKEYIYSFVGDVNEKKAVYSALVGVFGLFVQLKVSPIARQQVKNIVAGSVLASFSGMILIGGSLALGKFQLRKPVPQMPRNTAMNPSPTARQRFELNRNFRLIFFVLQFLRSINTQKNRQKTVCAVLIGFVVSIALQTYKCRKIGNRALYGSIRPF